MIKKNRRNRKSGKVQVAYKYKILYYATQMSLSNLVTLASDTNNH